MGKLSGDRGNALQEYMAPMLEQLGLAFVPGVLVQPEGYVADYLWASSRRKGQD
ncbi:MAG: hypothetical protein ACLU4N_13835 [Butyricimonas faecihominis]